MLGLDKIVIDMVGKPLAIVRLVILWMIWVGATVATHFDINIISRCPSQKSKPTSRENPGKDAWVRAKDAHFATNVLL